MKDLIKRIEAADGPSRELDYEIFCAAAFPNYRHRWDPKDGDNRFTSSIDAAMTLVPEGAHVTITMDGEFWLACVGGFVSRSKYLAMALCAASLRAVMTKNEG